MGQVYLGHSPGGRAVAVKLVHPELAGDPEFRRRFAREVGERFRPDKIILFGSYAYGKPDQDSDVDILVVMPAYDEINQAVRILEKTSSSFPLDLIVRTPENLRWRLREADWFLREVVGRGTVLYEKAHRGMGSQGRKRLSSCQKPSRHASTRPR